MKKLTPFLLASNAFLLYLLLSNRRKRQEEAVNASQGYISVNDPKIGNMLGLIDTLLRLLHEAVDREQANQQVEELKEGFNGEQSL